MADIFTYDLDIDMKQEFGMGWDIEVHQLDVITLNCSMWNEGIIFDATNFTVELEAKRPDGNDYIQSKFDIEKGVGYVKIDCTDQLTVASGKVKAQLRIYNETLKQRTSRVLYIRVVPSVLEVDRKVSESTITALQYVENTLNRLNEVDIDLTDKINEGTILKNGLTTLNSTATNLKTSLTSLNPIAETNYNNLKDENDEATYLIPNLTSKNDIAQTTKTELQQEISLADQRIIDLKNFDPNSVVQNTNTMLNEMYCNNELLSINHGLDGYPVVQLVYTEYGAGVGGAGDFPAGSDSECNLMQNKTVYTDNNNFTIYVPNNYYIESPEINKINDYKYIVTFPSSTRSLLINIKV